MSQLISKESENNLVLIDLLNRHLRADIQEVLKLIQLKKQNATNLEKYETKKKFLLQMLKDNNEHVVQEVKLKHYFNLFYWKIYFLKILIQFF
jgi:hypothetical protein